MRRLLLPLFLVLGCAPAEAPMADPELAVSELLAQDVTFAEASGQTDLITGVTPIFSDQVMTALPGRGWVSGATEAIAALKANPVNTGARLTWSPIRAGVSGDGLHGFTFGYMTLHRADSVDVPLKYLAYWVREPDGWRVRAWKRRPRGAGAVDLTQLPAFLGEPVTVSTDTTTTAAFATSLAAAEQAFSDEAQTIGLGPAFARWGRPDAVNMGGPDAAAFVAGADAIGASVGAGVSPTDTVTWSADHVTVAASGDLGITFGMIHAGGNAIPFFTVWARPNARAEWRYIAE